MKSIKKSKLVKILLVGIFMLCTCIAITHNLPINKLSTKQITPISINQSDDNYEENDDRYDYAYDLSSYEQTWLSTIDGPGIQADFDWYEIYIEPGYENLVVNVTFTHLESDISLRIENEEDAWSWTFFSSFDYIYLDITVPSSGTYFILIYGDNAGNEYDLWWDDAKYKDDNYEINNWRSEAYNLSNHENIWLDLINGHGIQFENDWYEIYIKPGYEHLIVECFLTETEGNIYTGVYNSTGWSIAENESLSNHKKMDLIVPSSGTYYIVVYGDNVGFTYNLLWKSQEYTPPTSDDTIPSYNLWLLLSTLIMVSIVPIRKLTKRKLITRN